MTRIDIEDELAERLRAVAKTRGISLREYVVELLQEGVSKVDVETSFTERFKQRVWDLGASLDNPWAALTDLETDEYMKLFARK